MIEAENARAVSVPGSEIGCSGEWCRRYEGFMNAKFFEEQRREMVAAIRVITDHMAAEIGKTGLDERVLRAMAKVRDTNLCRSRSNSTLT